MNYLKFYKQAQLATHFTKLESLKNKIGYNITYSSNL